MSEYKPYFTINSTKFPKATVVIVSIVGGALVVASLFLSFYSYASTHLPLTTHINGVSVGNKTIAEANNILSGKLQVHPPENVSISVDGKNVDFSTATIDLHYEFQNSVTRIMTPPQQTHTRWKVYQTIKRFFTPYNSSIPLSFNEEKMVSMLSQLQQKIDTPAIEPAFTLKKSGVINSLQVEAGKPGQAVDVEEAQQTIIQGLAEGKDHIAVTTKTTGKQLSDSEVKDSAEWAKKFVGKTIKLTKEGLPVTLNDQTILSILQPPNIISDKKLEKIVAQWNTTVERKAQDPVFEYDPQTLKVTKFTPPRSGLTIDVAQTKQTLAEIITDISNAADEDKKTVYEKPLAIVEEAPKKSLASTNNLGIQERIGFGESYYAHSIPNRIHNVGLTASRVTDTIVKPGDEFSFNKTLGDVSAQTGYKSAYVIKDGQTVLGDGGGVCQVSSTLFRALLDAGLQVTRRIPHSYRVSYYELNSKPGFDATVYAGATDLRFINDTDHAVLIHAETDSKHLYMFVELYGTSDGRTTEIVDYKTWNAQPAPPSVYIPDPTLPHGKTVQVDWAAAGINASFTNIVKDKTGKVMHQDTYVSHYQPWSAKYLQGI